MNDSFELEQFLETYLAFELSDAQVAEVSADFGSAPLDTAISAEGAATGPADLQLSPVERDVLEGVWRQITSPRSLVIVERVVLEHRYVWTMLVSSNGVVEQVRGPDGYTWLFCSSLQLLGRVLLDTGMLRANQVNGEALDPLPDADRWTVEVSVIPDLGDPQNVTEIRFSWDGQRWHGVHGPCERLEAIDSLAAMLGEALDEPVSGDSDSSRI